jgi:tRNA(Ser,Leu) C12 N-acetylase TAN1
MNDWNVIVALFQDPRSFRRARNIMRQLGAVSPSEFHNVLLMRVENLAGFLRDFSAMLSVEPGIQNDISRVVPLMETFEFSDRQEFEDKAREIALSWVPRLKGRSFYVRLHRRGLKSALQSPIEERFLDEALLSALEEAHAPGRISFEDPDAVIDIESVGHRAGMSLWTRDDLARYPFLKVD